MAKENPGINTAQQAAIKSALAKLSKKQPALLNYDRYYRGDHKFNYASEKFATSFGPRLRNMRDNLCKTCVRAPSDRLEILGFSSDSTSKTYNETWDIWKTSKMPQISRRLHRDAYKNGDAYLMVWPSADGKARMTLQDPRTCTVFYNKETETIVSAAKSWQGEIDKFIYLTLYYPDRIEKYISRNKQGEGAAMQSPNAFIRRQIPNEPWPIPNPFGVVPVFHFGLESSILDDVIPLQDALNKEIADMLVGSESNSIRQRWTSGISYEVDPETGEKIIPFDRASQWHTSNNENAKFGEFQDVSLTEFLAVITDFRNEIANVAGIPSYYFKLGTGDFPSGEALSKAESRFTSLITDAQLEFGETWAAAVSLALEMNGKKPEKELETQWKEAAPMSPGEKLDLAIKKKAIGVSDERNLSEIGYTDADIEKMKAENQAAATQAGDAFGRVFDAGSQAVGGN